MVVQADELLALSTVLVSPTSTAAPPSAFRPTIELDGTPTRVLVEQTTAVSPERLGDSVGRSQRDRTTRSSTPPSRSYSASEPASVPQPRLSSSA